MKERAPAILDGSRAALLSLSTLEKRVHTTVYSPVLRTDLAVHRVKVFRAADIDGRVSALAPIGAADRTRERSITWLHVLDAILANDSRELPALAELFQLCLQCSDELLSIFQLGGESDRNIECRKRARESHRISRKSIGEHVIEDESIFDENIDLCGLKLFEIHVCCAITRGELDTRGIVTVLFDVLIEFGTVIIILDRTHDYVTQ